MRNLAAIQAALREQMPYLREHYSVDRLGICGSYVRGEQTEESDVDLLVTFSETPGLFKFVNLKHYLEDTLGLDVNLGMPDALKEGPAAENIRREAQYLYNSSGDSFQNTFHVIKHEFSGPRPRDGAEVRRSSFTDP